MSDISANATASIIARLQSVPGDVAAVGLAFGLIIVPLGLFGNVLIVTTVCVDRSLRKKTNVFIVSMAVADTVMLLCRDVFMVDTYVRRHWAWGGNMVVFFFFVNTCRNILGLEHIVAITVYRYFLIVHNHHYDKIAKTAVMVCILVFMYVFPPLVAAVSAPFVMESGEMQVSAVFRTKTMTIISFNMAIYVSKSHFNLSDTMLEQYATDTSTAGLMFIVFYVIANAAVLVVCYVHIYVFLSRHARIIKSWAVRSGQTPADDKVATKRNKQEVKVVQMMSAVFILFLISYILMPLFFAADSDDEYSYAAYLPFVLCNWLVSCSNWILYTCTNPFFRNAFLRVLRGDRGSQVRDIATVTAKAETKT